MAQHEGTLAIADQKSLVNIDCSSVMSYFTLHIKVYLYCCHTLAKGYAEGASGNCRHSDMRDGNCNHSYVQYKIQRQKN